MESIARFKGRNVIVTGAGSGIGQATVLRLVAEGAMVLAVDLNERGLEQTQEQVLAAGARQIELAVLSVTDEAAIAQRFAAFAQEQGGIHALVNLAGILTSRHTTEMSLDDFMQVQTVNLGGTFVCCKEALPYLLESHGNIVNAASTSAFFGHAYMAAYSASKGAIAALTQALSREYLNRGVRVNAIAPGGIATPMVAAQAQSFPEGADFKLYMHLSRPDRQLGKPEDVAAVIALLASDDGNFINGEVVRIDGGTHG